MSRFAKASSTDPDFKTALAAARAKKATRLMALAYDPGSPYQWHTFADEAAMKRFLNSRDEAESISFNCSVAVVVVNPQDSDETITAILEGGNSRRKDGPGYFSEAF